MKNEKKDERIKLICASPFENFEKFWNFNERHRYNSIMKKADYVKFVCTHYSKSCFQTRNCYMVDRCSRVISAYNGQRGGTYNTIRYAEWKNIQVINIFD